MRNDSSVESPLRAVPLAFLVAMFTLIAQILVHRVVSAKLLNNYAFLVISLTMFGFAVSGTVLTIFREQLFRRAKETIALLCAAYSILTLCATIFFYQMDAGSQFPRDRADFVANALKWVSYSLTFSIPFACGGLVLGMLLSDRAWPTARVYFSDLLGSALGAALVVPAVAWLGVEKSLMISSGAFAVLSFVLVRPYTALARVALALATVFPLGLSTFEQRAFRMRYPSDSTLWETQRPNSGVRLEYTKWDTLARIEVSRIPPPRVNLNGTYPSLYGTNQVFLNRFDRMLTQNNYAFTYAVRYDGKPESLKGIEETIYSAAYHASTVARPRVGIVGVGGGFDVLTALAFNASHVKAIEVNAATVHILTRQYSDYFAPWVRDPRVELVNAEGRHELSRSQDQFDVLQLSGVDTYSGSPGAAHVFSENFLYTEEAFDLYLSRLSDDGILNMMRLEAPAIPREMLKALVLADRALRRIGVTRTRDHIVMLTQPNFCFTALLVKKRPFSASELDRLHAWAEASPVVRVSASPRSPEAPTTPYEAFLGLETESQRRAFVAIHPFDIEAPTDDRPFFFRHSRWNHLWPEAGSLLSVTTPVMEYSVVIMLVLTGTAAVVCTLLPLWFLPSRSTSVPFRWRAAGLFAATALGFMAIEVALLQKFGLFLGHPNYSLSVVLAALLFFSGVGSYLSGTLTARLGGLRFVSYALASVILFEYFFVLDRLPSWFVLDAWIRVFVVTVLVAPIGVCLGVFVPAAIDRLKTVAPELVPWCWGLNGIVSVIAPILAVAFSMSWGVSALLIASIPIYMLGAWVFTGNETLNSGTLPSALQSE